MNSKNATADTKTDKAVSARGRRKVREGLVVSNKMTKTIVIEVSRVIKHALYKKYLHRSSKLYVHDEKGLAGVGDLVRVEETKPLSRLKRWKLKEIVRKAA
jgi:small subunit ribosomal protein S17